MHKAISMPSARRLSRACVWCLMLWLAGAWLRGGPTAAAAAPGLDPVGVDERGLAIAEAFVRRSATFRFDGMAESLRLESVRSLAACPQCYEYVLAFESRYPGFGDRTGLGLTAAPTAHRATIVLRDRRVVSGVLDGAWDMKQQRILDFE